MPVFKPRQSDDDDIQCCDEQQQRGVRKAVSIHLVENEQAENRDGGRIVPTLLPPETNDEPEFDGAVAKQIEGREVLAAHGQALRSMEQIIGNEVARVFRQFQPGDGLRQIKQELSGNEVGEHACGDFRQCKHTFEYKTDLKGSVYVRLVEPFLYAGHFLQSMT